MPAAGGDGVTMTFYRTSPIKRPRRTKDDINIIKGELIEVLAESNPMTVRQVFYQMTSRGYIPKTEAAYKGTVCRLLADMRLDGTIPFGWISDNTRWMRKPDTYDSAGEMLRNNLETYRRAPILHRERILSEYYTERTPFLLGGARNGGSRGKDKKPRKKRGGLKAIPLQYQKSRLI